VRRHRAVVTLTGGIAVFAALVLSACAGPPAAEDTPAEPTMPARIVAIGDLHGDLDATRAALRLAGAIDSLDRWIGADLVLVQTGDVLDRGDDEEAIIRLFERLAEEADAAGGAVHALNGNHELMNAYYDYRYVTDGGYADFEDVTVVETVDSLLATLKPEQRARAQALRPGGEFARLLAERNIFLIIGNTLFTHGSVLPEHVDLGLDQMNGEIQAWLRNEAPQPEWIRGDRSPVWNRLYSDGPDLAACDTLASVLDRLDVKRLVVGHTVQDAGITAYCGGRVWCIDVGMAEPYGGRPEALEIRGDAVRGLR
jgi:hypothetical protein